MRKAIWLLVAGVLIAQPGLSRAQYPSLERIRQYNGHQEAVGGGTHAVPIPPGWNSDRPLAKPGGSKSTPTEDAAPGACTCKVKTQADDGRDK